MSEKPPVKDIHAYYFYDGAAKAFESALVSLQKALTDTSVKMTLEQRIVAYQKALRDLVAEYEQQAELTLAFAHVAAESQ